MTENKLIELLEVFISLSNANILLTSKLKRLSYRIILRIWQEIEEKY